MNLKTIVFPFVGEKTFISLTIKNMIKKTKKVKKQEKILPNKVIILQDVCRTIISNAFLIEDLIEELIDQK